MRFPNDVLELLLAVGVIHRCDYCIIRLYQYKPLLDEVLSVVAIGFGSLGGCQGLDGG